MKRFYDIESDTVISEKGLEKEFEELRKEDPCTHDYTFAECAYNCMTDHNGTLELMRG